MASHATLEREAVVFSKRKSKNREQWFVRISCNLFQARIYGPFVAEQDAERFREGAAFELRKLLDCQLPTLSGNDHLHSPQLEL